MTLSTILGRKTTTQGVAEVRRRSVRGGLGLLVMLFGLVGSRTAFADGTYLPVIVADFNHDGIPDVLIPSNNSPTATVSLGTLPGGSFNGTSRAVTLPAVCTQTAQGSMVVGDFNGDGLSDIAFFCGASGGVGGVLLSNGDGTFATAKTFSRESIRRRAWWATSITMASLTSWWWGRTARRVQDREFSSSTATGTARSGSESLQRCRSRFVLFVSGRCRCEFNDGYADIVARELSLPARRRSMSSAITRMGPLEPLTQGVATASVSASVGTQGESTDGAQILVGNFFGASGTDFAVPDTGSTPGIFRRQEHEFRERRYSLGTAVQDSRSRHSEGRRRWKLHREVASRTSQEPTEQT